MPRMFKKRASDLKFVPLGIAIETPNSSVQLTNLCESDSVKVHIAAAPADSRRLRRKWSTYVFD